MVIVHSVALIYQIILVLEKKCHKKMLLYTQISGGSDLEFGFCHMPGSHLNLVEVSQPSTTPCHRLHLPCPALPSAFTFASVPSLPRPRMAGLSTLSH